ncbi:MAG: tetratricopeptide repeat protein, partial [Myxococcales bacterium]|nr:tetratricopeptide repeat protein [Myxococcales bacterium]
VIAGHLSPLANAVTGRLTPEEAALAEETRGLNLRDIVAAGIVAQVTATHATAPLEANLRLLARARELNPESYLVHFNTGKLLLLAGRAADAEGFLAKAVELRPDDVPSLRDLGMVYVVTGQPQRAVPPLQRAVRLAPDEFGVRNYLGSALAMTGDPAAAIPHFEHALRLRPDDAAVRQNLQRARGELRR